MSMVAATLRFSSCLFLIPLSYFEHRNTIQPSTVTNVYLAMSLLFDAAQNRTLLLISPGSGTAIVFTIATAVRSLGLLIEMFEKKRMLLPSFKDSPPEATSGILNRAFFWWLNRLFLQGYTSKIHTDQLFALDRQMCTDVLLEQFQKNLLRKGWPVFLGCLTL
jgi:hypothetical protein